MFNQTDQLAVDTIRTLSIDMVEKAESGHPGLPMGAAPMAYVLWKNHLNINPSNSNWFDRDRFILSAGHGSALLYSLLFLSGYDLTIDDLKGFRQVGSLTPGHPEVHHTDGIETTTGPLGQGFANAVGFAMAEAHLAGTYNQDDYNVIDHHTYVIASDGDLQEGISHEAASLAGHLELDKLIVLYDSNDVQLDGPTNLAFSEDIEKRFEAYGWEHIFVKDGTDLQEIDDAINKAKESDKPSIIEIKTVIGEGSKNAGTASVHGAPLGAEDTEYAKKAYGWEHDEFEVPTEVDEIFKKHVLEAGQEKENEWNKLVENYKADHKDLATALQNAIDNKMPENWDASLPKYNEVGESKATRALSGDVINAIAKEVKNFWGGSADLSGSNKTMIDGVENFQADNYAGRNIWYGVREHAMASALNGIVLHGGTKSFVSTFFVFSDYLRPAVRLAALSQVPTIYVFTHDSIAVGEDGPTHEPVEQMASFRAMHNVNVLRPADGNEVREAWKLAMESTDTPHMLVLTRQGVPTLENSAELAEEGVSRGAYVISPQKGNKPDGIIIATGSEVSLAVEAQKALAEEGVDISVVSMPSMDIFEQQDDSYKETVLPSGVTTRLAVEMGSSFGWDRYVGSQGGILAIDRFGASGKGPNVVEEYGFTVENVVDQFKNING